jgi:predicted SAM-dependent methyltransferase
MVFIDEDIGAGGAATAVRGPRLNIGCAEVKYPGWMNIDILPDADVVVDVTRGLPWADKSVPYIYNERFVEHLSVEEARAFLAECRRVLLPGGVLRIATPHLEFLLSRAAGDWRDQDWLSGRGSPSCRPAPR